METMSRGFEFFDIRDDQRRFLSGTQTHPISVVEVTSCAPTASRLPVVMIHGGFHTGRSFLRTPDDRMGWGHLFAMRGHTVLIPDWPGHGRSPGFENLAVIGTQDVAESIGVLVQDVGRCILVAHSAGGPVAWWLAENYPELVAAAVGVAPGSPANLLPALPSEPGANPASADKQTVGHPIYAPQDQIVRVSPSFVQEYWANSALFPVEHLQAYIETVVPESPRILSERFNIEGKGLRIRNPEVVGDRPILIVTGEHDLRHPKHIDAALANFLNAKFCWLPDEGIRNNGHMQMLESNNHDIAALIFDWLNAQFL
jgi:pimeloyl-ACP methyl ester carboxylesterase